MNFGEHVYPRRLEVAMGQPRIEVMADSMRAGKTTAVDVIVKEFREKSIYMIPSYEDWENNPHLKKSYGKDPGASLLESQKWFAERKYEQLREIRPSGLVQDVSPEMDYCYALTNYQLERMSRKQFEEYREFYLALDWAGVALPHVLVYLALSDEELIRRATSSLRTFEQVDEKYLLTMKRVNREWLDLAPDRYRERTLIIQEDQRNFATAIEDQNWLVNQVAKKLGVV